LDASSIVCGYGQVKRFPKRGAYLDWEKSKGKDPPYSLSDSPVRGMGMEEDRFIKMPKEFGIWKLREEK
jgi:hypothetical protein